MGDNLREDFDEGLIEKKRKPFLHNRNEKYAKHILLQLERNSRGKMENFGEKISKTGDINLLCLFGSI